MQALGNGVSLQEGRPRAKTVEAYFDRQVPGEPQGDSCPPTLADGEVADTELACGDPQHASAAAPTPPADAKDGADPETAPSASPTASAEAGEGAQAAPGEAEGSQTPPAKELVAEVEGILSRGTAPAAAADGSQEVADAPQKVGEKMAVGEGQPAEDVLIAPQSACVEAVLQPETSSSAGAAVGQEHGEAATAGGGAVTAAQDVDTEKAAVEVCNPSQGVSTEADEMVSMLL